MERDKAADQRLAAKIRKGDFDADVEAWIRRLAKNAMATARRWGHTYEDAEDFVHDFWVALLANGLRTYDPEQSLFTYCFTIFLNRFKRSGSRRAMEIRNAEPIEPVPSSDRAAVGGAVLVATGPSAEQAMISDEERGMLQLALDALEHEQRQLIIDRVLDEQTYAEIAERLDIPEGAVRVRLHRALKNLQRTMSVSNVTGSK